MQAISLKKISKTYKAGHLVVPVLFDVDLDVESGGMVALMGPSGSGKSTLVNIIGLLDRPTKGSVYIGGEEIKMSFSDSKLASLRSEKIGFVFQSFQLLPSISILENVLLPTIYSKKNKNTALKRAKDLLKDLGLANRLKHRPNELSGGEKQRVAIARSLINDPEFILADEPTGNLDSKSGSEVMQILEELRVKGKTIIVVTHDPQIAAYCQKTVQIFDGKIIDGENHV
jgi:putative ABC transport system ATP-binding protein